MKHAAGRWVLAATAAGGMILGNHLPCAADVIYLKNGRIMEGEVRRTDKGFWIEGALFEEDEIERIEKTKPAASPSAQKPAWYSGILNKMGIAPQETPQAASSSAPAQASSAGKGSSKPAVSSRQGNQAAVAVPQAAPVPMGLPLLAPSAAAPQGSQVDFSGMIEQAQRLQDEAYRRQMMMMQEIQRVEQEEAGYTEAVPSAAGYPQQEAPLYDPSLYQRQDSRTEKSGEEDEDRGDRKGSRKFKSIDIDDYGNMSWE